MDSCPDIAELQQYLDDLLGAKRAGQIDDHIIKCRTCEAALDELCKDPSVRDFVSHCGGILKDESESKRLSSVVARLGTSQSVESLDPPTSPVVPIVTNDSASTANPRRDGVQRTVGRYELLTLIGRSAAGDVYRAFDPQLERAVVVKLLRSRSWASSDDEHRFLHDARRAAQLRHAGLVAVHDIGREENQFYIVTDFVDGIDLKQKVRGQRMPIAEAASLVAEVCDALHYAHQNRLIHREVKPSNILLDHDGRVCVADLGMRVNRDESLAQDGYQFDTLPYLAPEQVRGDEDHVDHRSDIYSLGIILYELLCGRPPLSADDGSSLVDKIIHNEPRPPRSIDDTIPRELERITLKAISKSAAERYGSASEMAKELRQALASTPLASSETESPAKDVVENGSQPHSNKPKSPLTSGSKDPDFVLNFREWLTQDKRGVRRAWRYARIGYWIVLAIIVLVGIVWIARLY